MQNFHEQITSNKKNQFEPTLEQFKKTQDNIGFMNKNLVFNFNTALSAAIHLLKSINLMAYSL